VWRICHVGRWHAAPQQLPSAQQQDVQETTGTEGVMPTKVSHGTSYSSILLQMDDSHDFMWIRILSTTHEAYFPVAQILRATTVNPLLVPLSQYIFVT
jgi:hypothetical protein